MIFFDENVSISELLENWWFRMVLIRLWQKNAFSKKNGGETKTHEVHFAPEGFFTFL